ncbi:hypothetical protein [Haladaptatus pallidirubidus]|uniref:hypothetical protein n=1 Tax=Haladaptatus pallidirubidus TaxID=1008152 RepID=UPI001D114CD2|nr:hypothetical protein [Haladaptatus pallidirubidus]
MAAVGFTLVVVGLTAVATPGLPFLAVLALAELNFVANCVGAVREHALYHAVNTLLVAVLFSFSYLTRRSPVAFPFVLAALFVLGFGVELYNYRHGTSYLRIDFYRSLLLRPGRFRLVFQRNDSPPALRTLRFGHVEPLFAVLTLVVRLLGRHGLGGFLELLDFSTEIFEQAHR